MSSIREEVEEANRKAVERMIEAEPLIVDIVEARKVIDFLDKGMALTHAGPPIEWGRMSGPLRGAVIGAVMYEGWADNPEKAMRLAEKGEIKFSPNHHNSAVAPMAGVISPSMRVIVVKNKTHGNIAYTNLNEGLGKVLRYGAYSRDVLDRLRFLNEVVGEGLANAVREIVKKKGGINLRNMIAQALHMGDECHNRNIAGTALFIRETSHYICMANDRDTAVKTLRFLDENFHFFVNLAMVAGKAMADAAHGIRLSTVVTAISRNGTDTGIRVSGLGDSWFTAPAPTPRGLYFPGFGEKDANPDIGDSTITETVGLGGAAMATSPAIVRFVGGTVSDAVKMTRRMEAITIAKHKYFTIPYLDFMGTPTGIDVRLVIKTGITPMANTGIAHREPGIGQVGAGIVEIPMQPFKDALRAFGEVYGV